MKKCTTCGVSKSSEQFSRNRARKDGLDWRCKACASVAYRRQYANPATRARRIARSKAWGRDNKPRHMWLGAKRRAAQLGVPFTISVDDVVIPARCPVLDIPVFVSDKGSSGPTPNSPSLDRAVPELGYVPGNVVVMSNRANLLKNDGTADEHEAIAAWMRSRKT